MSASSYLSHHTNVTTSLILYPTKTQCFSYNRSKLCAISRSNPSNSSDSEIKSEFSEPVSAPTAPWMNEPLLVKPNEILKFKKARGKKDFTFGRNVEHPDVDLTQKVGGGRGRIAMKKIFKSIEKLKEAPKFEESRKDTENSKYKFGPGELWGEGGVRNRIEEASDEVKEFNIPLKEVERERRVKRMRMPWEGNERIVAVSGVKERRVNVAELSLDGELLERLRAEAAVTRKWVKVKKAGVTEAVVDQVRVGWRTNELVLIKFDIPLCKNMDRAKEIVEAKTGGIVVWSKKDFLAVYRWCSYLDSSKDNWKKHHDSSSDLDHSSDKMNYENTTTIASLSSDEMSLVGSIHCRDGVWESLHMSSLYERESDRLLDGLGPRFVDWWMQKPLPVDADLLPEIVPGLKTPVRLSLPHGSRSQLRDDELTYLRKLARPLPTHFVLGRNRKLQGLAAAIMKLWEKCHIAKIAVKWGVQNTDNEQMAEELKSLTGGVLLLRNKYIIILYRGKDFVPSDVANLVAERETELTRYQFEEEAARIKASETFSTTYEHLPSSGIIGTLSEFHSIQSDTSKLLEVKTEVDVQVEAEREKLEKELKDQQQKLFILKKKIERSAKVLEKLSHADELSEQDADLEIISQEERECLRQLGMKTDSTLVLGRRGIYDGVIEGMHQHWKHREIVKVITMQKKYSQINYTAKRLESESGGILVSIVKLKEGHAIITYRGKNFKRPKVSAQNLLNKKEALSRSLEIQRIGSLRFFAKQREQTICDLKRKLAEFPKKN